MFQKRKASGMKDSGRRIRDVDGVGGCTLRMAWGGREGLSGGVWFGLVCVSNEGKRGRWGDGVDGWMDGRTDEGHTWVKTGKTIVTAKQMKTARASQWSFWKRVRSPMEGFLSAAAAAAPVRGSPWLRLVGVGLFLCWSRRERV